MALTMEESAIVAAAQATEAAVELLRFAREGAFSNRCPFGDDVVSKLAEALTLAIGMEGDPADNQWLDEDERAQLTALRDAAAAFIEGWAG